VLNACQASRKGDSLPTVKITLDEDDQRISIAVSDTGKGVPPEIRETLFQPFVSFGKVNGTGLGLTVALHVAQEHGGEVRLDTNTAKGATFTILLYKRTLPTPEPRQANPWTSLAPFEEPVRSSRENL
jgi:signal transduction histidine kinase